MQIGFQLPVKGFGAAEGTVPVSPLPCRNNKKGEGGQNLEGLIPVQGRM